MGLKSLDYCTDYFNNEYSVYGLGAALALIAVVLVLQQLLKPIHQLRLAFRIRTKRFGITLFVLNLVAVLIAALLPYIPGPYLPLISYTIFWEIIGGLLFLISILILITIALKPIKRIGKGKNLAKLYSISLRMLAYESVENHEALASELGYFIDDLTQFLTSKDEWIKQSASSLILLLTEPKFCKFIATKEPITLQNIIVSFRDLHGFTYEGREFIQCLINQSLLSHDSILVREMQLHGLGETRVITYNLFKKFSFIANYELLGNSFSHYVGYGHSEQYKDNFIKFWQEAVRSFFSITEVNIEYSYALYHGLLKIAGLTKHTDTGELSYFSPANSLQFPIQENEEGILKYYDEIPKIPLNKKGEYNQFEDRCNFFGALAQGIYACLEPHSKTDRGWLERNHYLTYHDILKQQSKVFKGINSRLEILIKNKIDENLRGYYPMTIRSFFHIFGFSIFTEGSKITKFQKEILKMIGERLPKFMSGMIYYYPKNTKDETLKKNKKEAQLILKDMLPDGMSYDSKTNTLTYMFKKERNGSRINLNKLINEDLIELVKFGS